MFLCPGCVLRNAEQMWPNRSFHRLCRRTFLLLQLKMEIESSKIIQSWRLYLFKCRDCCVASVAKLRYEYIREAVAEMASGTHRFLASAARVFLEIT